MNIVLSGAKEVVTKGMRKDLPPLPSIIYYENLLFIDLPGEDISIETKRGLVIIRGITIVSVHICGPPPANIVLK